jgi:hypothetical protein
MEVSLFGISTKKWRENGCLLLDSHNSLVGPAMEIIFRLLLYKLMANMTWKRTTILVIEQTLGALVVGRMRH